MNKSIEALTLVGCGAMGSALLRGWLRTSEIKEFWVITPHRESVETYIKQDPRVKWFASPTELPGSISCLVIALKPFALKDALPSYRKHVDENSLIISVATGKTLEFYREIVGYDVVRAMPNTPVSVNQGVIGLVSTSAVKTRFEDTIERILGNLGYVTWVETEEQLNQVTALSGSGPAYVYYTIEAMAKAGESLGLSSKQAYNMALHTVIGAAAYALDSGISAKKLRENVTSSKGTTEQALSILMAPDEGLEALMTKAVKAAFQRAEELAK